MDQALVMIISDDIEIINIKIERAFQSENYGWWAHSSNLRLGYIEWWRYESKAGAAHVMRVITDSSIPHGILEIKLDGQSYFLWWEGRKLRLPEDVRLQKLCRYPCQTLKEHGYVKPDGRLAPPVRKAKAGSEKAPWFSDSTWVSTWSLFLH